MLRSINIAGSYTQEENPLDNFYGPCLSKSKSYLRAAGYFRSTILHLVPSYLNDFVLNDGKIKLLCSPHLQESDANIFLQSLQERNNLVNKQIDQILADLKSSNHMKIFSSLIKFNYLDIKIVFKKNGIFHEKWGVFNDNDNNEIYFSGSTNETFNAWNANFNFENLETRCSWKSEEDFQIIRKRKDYFFELWNNKKEEVVVDNITEETLYKIKNLGYDKKDEFLEELKLINDNKYSKSKITKRNNPISIIDNARDHQKKAFLFWVENQQKALFKHCTGAGKTFTGILALEHHFKSNNIGIVIVPTEILLNQWEKDIKNFLPDISVLKCGGNNTTWKKISNSQLISSQRKVLFISILNTASTPEFLSLFSGINENFLLVDEVHSIGANSFRIILDEFKNVNSKLGVSATPERFDDGYQKIVEYFGNIVNECQYNISDGINDGYLCEYDYHNSFVELNEEELKQWNILTKRITILRAQKNDTDETNDKLDNLIFTRSLIAQNAESKIPKAVDIIENNCDFSKDRFLVFCINESQLEALAKILNEKQIPYMKYHSKLRSKVKTETLDNFYKFGGLILSIRCLDEGVDIPAATKALIIASSQNSRQFIQRRGRVLRKSENKSSATIFDILINIENGKNHRYFEKEIYRSWIFSKDANNFFENKIKLETVCLDNNLVLTDIIKRYDNISPNDKDNTELEND